MKDVVEEENWGGFEASGGHLPPADPYDWDKRSSLEEGKTVDQ